MQAAPAARPTNFTRDLSAYSLGYGTYYQTDDVAGGPALEPTPMLRDINFEPALTAQPIVTPGGRGGRALRYPPDYAACVLIERDSKYEVVILAEHHDTWNADWVLHTSTLSPQKLIATLGCPLNWPQ